MSRECRAAAPEDFPALGRMLELYQYELSDIWDQDLDSHGRFGYDTSKHRQAQRFFAHVLLVDQHYAGFALVAPAMVTRQEGFWMEQFFVLKKYRKAGHGLALARHVFQSHPGAWEVGQMPGNTAARQFWRSVVATVARGNFVEVDVTQGWWQGTVQQFNVEPAAARETDRTDVARAGAARCDTIDAERPASPRPTTPMHIAEPAPSRLGEVLQVHSLAFGRDDEARLVADLLRDPTAMPSLSLLADVVGEAVGHVLFTAVSLVPGTSTVPCAIMAPLAVVPGWQGQGVGRALVEQGCAALAARGVGLVFVLGDPGYYARCGFVAAAPHGLLAPYPIELEAAWRVRPLAAGLLGSVAGRVRCAATMARPEYWRE